MKQTFISLTLFAAAIVMTSSCSLKPPIKSHIITLADVTDPNIQKPRYEDIASHWEDDLYAGRIADFSLISDVLTSRCYQIRLNSAHPLFANRYKRQEEIESFNAQVRYMIDQINQKAGTRRNSTIFPMICRELDRLAQSPAETKILNVYSDLRSNDDLMDYYLSQDRELLRSNPKVIQTRLEEYCDLTSLDGIQIRCYHQAQSLEESTDYFAMIDILKSVLQPYGAEVISTSIHHDLTDLQ